MMKSIEVIKGTEGLGSTYLAQIEFNDFISTFHLQDQSIPEQLKMQRDVTKSRASKIQNYLLQREDWFFPEVIAVVSHSGYEESFTDLESGIEVGEINLSDQTQSILIDGQGRYCGISQAVAQNASLREKTIDVKVILVDGDLRKNAEMIRMIFVDLHQNVKRQTPSSLIHFDNSLPCNRFISDLLTHLEPEFDIFRLVSVMGTTNSVYKLSAFKTFVDRFTGFNTQSDKAVYDDDSVRQFLFGQITEYLHILSALPAMKQLIEGNADDSNLLENDVALEALGYLANVAQHNAILRQTTVDYSALRLHEVNFDKAAPAWKKVFHKGRLVRGSAKRIAIIIACQNGLALPEDLALM
ncbi:DGQHR domain-containing protein [Photobacterium sp. ZSDE20]|uniref:DGQHR domain-containing protein n=1 Tax=Photobacterium pectinilyticum TaxID=2906793 RepID=A0ABT1N7P3_9GAMM|nr:DNA sulfur modification protein DndB [Photobacterium sp. ZSDE20]MCQ1060770.1 DGQHR domain-containing protein [Photobacterium sp. ZSDE20]MDD1828459.1 DGQHR domain-containing protein [Photobacterium sp. ZSDE20]